MKRLVQVGAISVAMCFLGCGNDDAGAGVSAECRITEPVLAIREVPGQDRGFFRISDLRVTSDGTIYVLDGGNSRLMAFEPDGKLRWQTGREGAGPQEFMNATHLSLAGDTLAVWDFGNYRLSFWTMAGEHAGTQSFAETNLPGNIVSASVAGTTDRFVAPVLPGFSPSAPPRQLEGAIVLSSSTGAGTLDTLTTFNRAGPVMIRAAGAASLVNPPYPPVASYAVSSKGEIAFTLGSQYVIQVVDVRGANLVRIEGSTEYPTLTDDHRSRYARGLPDSTVAAQAEFPEELPAIAEVSIDESGTILVKTYWERDNLTRWDRWTKEGSFITSLLLPRDLRHVTGLGDRIFGVAEDEYEVPFVQVFRVAGRVGCIGPSARSST